MELFQHQFVRPPDASDVVRSTAVSFDRSWKLAAPVRDCLHRSWALIRWVAPTEGCVKLNTDGAARGNPGLAGAGGLVRDSNGRWLAGFMLNLGFASSVIAELRGVLSGLEMTLNLGVREVILEVDSMVVYEFLKNRARVGPLLWPVVFEIKGLLARNWRVSISHTYREGNASADWLARRSLDQSLGFHYCESVPSGLVPILMGDVIGVSMSRFVVSSSV